MEELKEEWRDVVGFEGFYKVSNTGLVASMPNNGKNGHRKRRGLTLKIGVHNKTGQTQVCLCVDGVRTKVEVSTLVAEAFLGGKPAGLQVLHIDCNNQNNRVDNLKYGSVSQKVRKTLNHYCEEMPTNKDLTQEFLKEFFSYKDGDLIVKKRCGFTSIVGEPAGFYNGEYKVIRVGGFNVGLNRAIYLYHHGILPDRVIHSDGDKENYRIENLKGMTESEFAVKVERIKNITRKG